MDLRLLEIFCRVYESRSFSRAAEALHLRQPTISSHMRSLEKQVGTALFERRGRAVKPTRAADILYDHGRRILELKGAAIAGLDRLLHRFEGELAIGGSTIPGEYLLPAIVASYREGHPGVAIRLHVGDTQGALERLDAGHVELAFVGARLPSRHLQFRRFAGDELVLVARADARWKKSVSVKELRGLPFVLREPGSGTRTMFEKRLARHGLELSALDVIAEIGSSNGVKEAVKAGIGVTVLSSRAVASELAGGSLRTIAIREMGRMERDFYAVRDRRRKPSLLAESFMKHALHRVR